MGIIIEIMNILKQRYILTPSIKNFNVFNIINEIFILQIGIVLTLWFYLKSINIIVSWYLAGVYLVILGLVLLINDGDVLVGFLWVIDLGVGLLFFIFILHFSNFLYQKATFNNLRRLFLFFIFLILFWVIFTTFYYNPINSYYNVILKQSWYIFISYNNFFEVFNMFITTGLILLRELFFINNSLQFVIINFMLMFAIFVAILLTFLIKAFFAKILSQQFKNFPLLKSSQSTYFIRNQNFIKQQHTSSGSRVWRKKKLPK